MCRRTRYGRNPTHRLFGCFVCPTDPKVWFRAFRVFRGFVFKTFFYETHMPTINGSTLLTWTELSEQSGLTEHCFNNFSRFSCANHKS